MAKVYLPTQWGPWTGDVNSLDIPAASLAELVTILETRFPPLSSKLRDGNRLAPEISVAINDSIANRGLSTRLPSDCEVHFLPAMGAG